MHFANPLPPWALAAVAVGIGVLAVAAYRRSGLPPRRRVLLTALRGAALALVVICLLRPVLPVDTGAREGGLVAVLVDVSRSMGLADAGGMTRLERAGAIVTRDLMPALAGRWQVETWLFGGELQRAEDRALTPGGDRSDLAGAVRETVERLRERGLAGLVVVSDGGDTSGADLAKAGAEAGVPIVTVGVGRTEVVDREVQSVAAGQSGLEASLVDLSVTVAARGTEGPMTLLLLQNGRVVERRGLTQAREGAPVRTVFTVAPDRTAPTRYELELAEAPGELTAGNNRVSVLVAPPGRRRRVLVLEGAPGFEHTFLKRAWAEDPSLEVDSAVRKGRNEQGADTFFVQAAGGRGAALATGFPATRAALFVYDVIVLANLEPHALTHEQMAWLRAFVSERGGGVLAIGAKTLAGEGLVGSPLEELLPLGPASGSGVLRASAVQGVEGSRVHPTPEGAAHPLMRIGASDADSQTRWAALPALAGLVPLGEPRPGASVLAVSESGRGTPPPVVAVQRFGAGRVLLFAGEASWRWRMLMPAADQSYERFWRQSARWLAADAPDQVEVTPPASALPGDEGEIGIVVRDEEFSAAPDAQVQVTIELPGGGTRELVPTLVDPARGSFIARAALPDRGVYRVHVAATREDERLGEADARWLVGGLDRELADPQLNEPALRRLAEAAGGQYLAADAAADAPRWLARRPAAEGPTEWRDAWHTGWLFGLIVALVSFEWTLRRRWGMR